MKSLIVLASFLITSIAMACPSGSPCAGDRVIDLTGHIGNVVESFSNGKTQVLYNGGGTSMKYAYELSTSVGCYGHICVGDRIIDLESRIGKAEEIFGNGVVKIVYNGYSTYDTKNAFELSTAAKCYQHICAGDKVVDLSNRIGEVVEVFNNGKVKIQFNGFSFYSIQNAYELSTSL